MVELEIHGVAPELDIEAAKAKLSEIKADKMSGWLTLPTDYDKDEFVRIKSAAEKINSDSKYLVCIGIGGSYLGHRAVIEALNRKSPTKILYAGSFLSPAALQQVLDELGDNDFSVNVISKSGTTTEPAVAFRIFKQKLIDKYGEAEAYKRIYATTDSREGALHDEAVANGYESFVVPDNIGGRYSVLTAVGLLPIAVAGVDIDKLMAGAREEQDADDENIYKYAAFRAALFNKDYDLEVLASFEPRLFYFAEWWKQLYGESEGKNSQGIFPAATIYTTDLHSLGQYMQEGRRNIFETIINVTDENPLITVPELKENLDGLKYLEGKSLSYINQNALRATVTAHSTSIPVVEITTPEINEMELGKLIYFFELSCAISAKMQGVDPFNQPGVDMYKNEMFRLLGKPTQQSNLDNRA
ncbi:glucose-6-phosphate isomerase [Candidatus Saccharibacteria bacterium]|nr:glucose-6-phosphate isomerase [Candidatus Saccharibacteria bacterium]